MAAKDEWSKLNKRQQTYMQALYKTDQEQEETERLRYVRTGISRKASEWRWMRYADTFVGYTPLKQRLIDAKAVDSGTGSTFDALKERGYALVRHEENMFGNTTPFLQITPKGRKLVRDVLAIPKKETWPTGQLRKWHWQALSEAYKAGDEGIQDERGYYAHIGWNTWLRLRDYRVKGEEKPLAQETPFPFCMRITEFGKQYYHENWQRYRELYPDVDAPEPQVEER